MYPVRDIAKSIIEEMEGSRKESSSSLAEYYRRRAIIDYAQTLKQSPTRTKGFNERSFEQAYTFAKKAISSGISEDRMDNSLRNLRDYWIPRLTEDK